jgi:hypothetical protein
MCLSAGSRARAIILVAPLVVGAVALLLHGPIPQDVGYYQFADRRAWAGIPNAGDVLSNVAFLAAGTLGLAFLASPRSEKTFEDRRERLPYGLFFAGVFLTTFGSTWYHLAPDTHRLFWDRLPMTIAFVALFAAVISERVSSRLARRMLWPLVAIGVASVLYWRVTEQGGRGDLRPYALVQYYPALAIVLLLHLSPPRYTSSGFLWAVAGAYALAKAFELADEPILRATRIVSGHTLKHLAAGAAAGLVLWMLARRRPIEGKHVEEER